MCNAGDLGILLSHTLDRINHNNNDIRTFHRRNSTDDTVSLNLFLDLVLSSEPRRINKHIFLSVVTDIRIDCISCRTRNIGNDHTILLRKLINKRRLTDIWLSDDGNLRALILWLILCRIREILNNFIKHITKSQHR